MKILAIESSCDETSAAVVEKTQGNSLRVLSNVTATSLAIHSKTGGIIPETAAREQVKWIIPVISQALCEAATQNSLTLKAQWETAREFLNNQIDAIAVTQGPGLIGSLLVGVETAKALSLFFNKPIIPVNHLLAHLFANFITYEDITFPLIGLIVSGGHTDLLYFDNLNHFKWLGGTRDDAAGEAIDKVGRLIGLSYPAGPEIEKRASNISENTIKFQSPLLRSDDFDFSFSGLKSEVMRYVEKNKPLSEDQINQICFATQKAIIEVLVSKTVKAVHKFHVNTVLLGGGVSANQTLKNEFKKINYISVFSPPLTYCTDNAAMIGSYALLTGEKENWKKFKANPELYFD